jgi:beta-glucosidase
MTGPDLHTLTAPDGTVFRDLDHDGQMAPFENPRLGPAERAHDPVYRRGPGSTTDPDCRREPGRPI